MHKKKNDSTNVINFINKFLLCTLIFLILAILSKSNINTREKIKDSLYKTNINFSYFKSLYNKYLGGVSIIKEKKSNTESVFNEKITYTNITDYEDGAKLEVSNNYLVPSIYKGIVVYIGNVDKYNNVIIIENSDGIDTWYGNICNSKLKLYDNIEKGDFIGESCDNNIFLVFKKGNQVLDYKKYLI